MINLETFDERIWNIVQNNLKAKHIGNGECEINIDNKEGWDKEVKEFFSEILDEFPKTKGGLQ